jgi:hypothetical protein
LALEYSGKLNPLWQRSGFFVSKYLRIVCRDSRDGFAEAHVPQTKTRDINAISQFH